MILIPTWLLLLEIGVLEGMLIFIFVRNRSANMGMVAGFLTIPIAWVGVMYIVTYFVSLQHARILARYAFAILFFSLILLFGRYIWSGKK